MSSLRKSTQQKPISQDEALKYITKNPDVVFEIEKIEIPVRLTKAKEGETVHTVTLARDGRTIDETTNTVQEGFGIDTRKCLDGSLDQYAKKPQKVASGYTIDDGRLFDDLAVGETVDAHTSGKEIRRAFVAEEDMYLDTTWGEVQFVAKGGLVTFMGDEAIGNNNPCDMVIHTEEGNGKVVLTDHYLQVATDLTERGLPILKGTQKFLDVIKEEDLKNPYWKKMNNLLSMLHFSLRKAKAKIVFALRGRSPELKDARDAVLRSSKDKPISQEAALTYLKMNPDAVFEIEKIEIPVRLTKAQADQEVQTTVLARDGRTIDETKRVTKEGFGIDTRTTINGGIDQYAKKPEKVAGGYTIDDGRHFDDLVVGETVDAHTKGREVRKAFVVPFDMYLDTTWGEVQFVAKGGLVTFMGDEAIGNNNPCDMVIHTKAGNGKVVLTKPASEICNDAEKMGIPLSQGAKKFLSVAHAEDVKNPYISTWREVFASVKHGMFVVQKKFESFLDKKHETKKKPTVKSKEKTAVKTRKKTNGRV